MDRCIHHKGLMLPLSLIFQGQQLQEEVQSQGKYLAIIGLGRAKYCDLSVAANN